MEHFLRRARTDRLERIADEAIEELRLIPDANLFREYLSRYVSRMKGNVQLILSETLLDEKKNEEAEITRRQQIDQQNNEDYLLILQKERERLLLRRNLSNIENQHTVAYVRNMLEEIAFSSTDEGSSTIKKCDKDASLEILLEKCHQSTEAMLKREQDERREEMQHLNMEHTLRKDLAIKKICALEKTQAELEMAHEPIERQLKRGKIKEQLTIRNIVLDYDEKMMSLQEQCDNIRALHKWEKGEIARLQAYYAKYDREKAEREKFEAERKAKEKADQKRLNLLNHAAAMLQKRARGMLTRMNIRQILRDINKKKKKKRRREKTAKKK